VGKLAIITTHPIQYYAPIFKLLAQKIQLRVFYTLGEQSVSKYDHGFGQQIEWDIPLLAGYDYQFLENISKRPGTHHFNGIINPGICEAVENFKPEAILIYGWAWKSHSNALRFFKGKVPVYFRGDSTLIDQQKSFKRLLRKYFLKWVYNHVDKAFYVGTANKAYFKHFGLKDDQLIFAPHAVDNDRFARGNILGAEVLRTQLGIKIDEILILFAGKFEPKKNPELLLDAFIDLDLKNSHLLFVGNGVLERSLKLKVEGLAVKVEGLAEKTGYEGSFDRAQDDNEGSWELGVRSSEEKINGSFDYAQDDKLEGTQDDKKDKAATGDIKKRIHFMDFQNQTEMPVVYQACDLFCLPSKGPGETWGLAVNEAMAAGKAILVSDKVGCAADLVNPGINGEVFRYSDLDGLMQKLRKLTGSKEKLTKMGIQSQQIIQNWSFEKQVKAIVDTIYNNDAK
jgi:glycosyltransferase involved in cell wall biosynthesis